ncbi:ATP-binding protein [Marinoscillum sp. 108]|jgi:serine/threonine-protein kinase RsbW|uniref:ATP-binding protein n=1 Tax=Marinoscillum luteum TaxID=861051 RepID=A0ABW7NDI6_9BACT|nr:ATP-binding protein [Marinoscillum sp. 108]VXD19126.1 Serine/threonine-protein kinase RsbW [Marinoscillum sp. 108]
MENKLTISCSKQNLAKIRQFVADILHRQAIKEVEAHKLVLAVDEICANLIIHSNHCNPTQTIEVYVDFQPAEQVTFVIRDQGISFNLSTYAEPSLDEIVSSRRKGGVGLMLVKRIMDKIEFSTEKNYNICKLTKKLSE